MALQQNHFHALGVDTKVFAQLDDNNKAEMLNKAFKQMMLKYHPDKNPGLSEEEQKKHLELFNQALEAYRILKDKDKREAYEAGLKNSNTHTANQPEAPRQENQTKPDKPQQTDGLGSFQQELARDERYQQAQTKFKKAESDYNNLSNQAKLGITEVSPAQLQQKEKDLEAASKGVSEAFWRKAVESGVPMDKVKERQQNLAKAFEDWSKANKNGTSEQKDAAYKKYSDAARELRNTFNERNSLTIEGDKSSNNNAIEGGNAKNNIPLDNKAHNPSSVDTKAQPESSLTRRR